MFHTFPSIRRSLTAVLALTVGVQAVAFAGVPSCLLSDSSKATCCHGGKDMETCCEDAAACRCRSQAVNDTKVHSEIQEVCRCSSEQPAPAVPCETEGAGVVRLLLVLGNAQVIEHLDNDASSVRTLACSDARPASKVSLNSLLCVWQT